MTFSVAESKYSKLSNLFSHNSYGTPAKTITSQTPFTFNGVREPRNGKATFFCVAQGVQGHAPWDILKNKLRWAKIAI